MASNRRGKLGADGEGPLSKLMVLKASGVISLLKSVLECLEFLVPRASSVLAATDDASQGGCSSDSLRGSLLAPKKKQKEAIAKKDGDGRDEKAAREADQMIVEVSLRILQLFCLTLSSLMELGTEAMRQVKHGDILDQFNLSRFNKYISMYSYSIEIVLLLTLFII